LNTIEDEAIVAAYSPARSEPGQDVSTLYDGRAIVMTSAEPHQAWSGSPAPTWP
jgi:hypothetical protein